MADDNIKVCVRVRPPVERELASGYRKCVSAQETSIGLSDDKVFAFDWVADEETSQDAVFLRLGKSICDSCLEGYNGTIFAYGQTGSGKTYTMQGPSGNHHERGLIPRMFEHLFALIAREEKRTGGRRQFLCKASYLEIYNERIYDLLDPAPAAAGLNLREDIKKGPFVEALRERVVGSPDDALAVLDDGSVNRTVGATDMNRESSRSHSVFTLVIQSKEDVDGVLQIRRSQLNLVDLAGSERQKSTNAAHARLKEASNINKSLSALGNVIMALVDIQKGKTRHIAYRDSKLTFLLKDSLGGNTKTAVIANVSPAHVSFGETLSTLKFAQRAKMITNNAIINEDMDGNVAQLQDQIRALKAELEAARAGSTVGALPADLDLGAPEDVSPENHILHLQLVLAHHINEKRKMADDAKRFKQRLNALNALISKQALTIQSTKLIIKLRDEALGRAGGASGSSPELDAANAEIDALRKLVDHNPKLTQIAIENLDLRDLLTEYQDKWGDDYAANQANVVKLHQYIQGLDFEMQRVILEKEALTKKIAELDESGAPAKPATPGPAAPSPLRANLALEQWKASMAFEERVSVLEAELESKTAAAAEAEGALAAALAAEKATVAELETSLASAATAHKLQLASLQSQLAESPDSDSLNDLLNTNAALEAKVAELEAQHRELTKAHAIATSKSERLSLSLSRKTSMDGRAAELEAQLEASKQREIEATTQAGLYSEKIATLTAALAKAEASEAAASAETLQAEAARDAAVLALDTANAMVEEQADKLETAEEEAAFVQSMLDSSQAVLAKSAARVSELEAQLADAEAKNDELVAQLAEEGGAGEAMMSQLADAKAEASAQAAAAASLKAEVTKLCTELEAKEAALEKSVDERESAAGQVQALRAQVGDLRAAASAAETEVDQLKSQAEETALILERFESENGRLEAKAEELAAQVAAMVGEHDTAVAELMDEVKRVTAEAKAAKTEAADEAASAASLIAALQETVEMLTASVSTAEEQAERLSAEASEWKAKASERVLPAEVAKEAAAREAAEARAAEAEGVRDAFVALQAQFETTRSAKAELEARVRELESVASQVEELEAARQALEVALHQAQDECEEALEEADAANAAAGAAQAALAEQSSADAKKIKALTKNLKKTTALGEQMFAELKHMKDLEEESFRDVVAAKSEIEALKGDKDRLSKEMAASAAKIDELSKEVAALSGHHNLKQKIQHHARVKEECNTLKNELAAALDEVAQLKRHVAVYQSQAGASTSALELSFTGDERAEYEALVERNAALSEQLAGMCGVKEQLLALEREVENKNFEIKLLQKASDFSALKEDSFALLDGSRIPGDDDDVSDDGDDDAAFASSSTISTDVSKENDAAAVGTGSPQFKSFADKAASNLSALAGDNLSFISTASSAANSSITTDGMLSFVADE